MKKLNNFLNILMASFFAVFLGATFINYQDFKKFPKIYETDSASWYFHGSLQSFILFIAVLVLSFIIKFIIRKIHKS